MEFIGFDQITAQEWDDVVYRSDDGWAFSLAAWLETVTPTWNMQNLSFAIRENGKLVAVMPLHWISAEKRLSSSGWGHGGPVIVTTSSKTDRQRLWGGCWAHAKDIASQFGAKRITVIISPLCQSSLNNCWGVNPLVDVGFADVSTHTRIISLLQSEEALWFGLAKDARQKVKQARSAGYSARRCSWREMVDEYYRVHVENYQRTGVQPHPKAYFEGIAQQSSAHHILWVGFSSDGSPVAFHNDARFYSSELYHTGCSETAHLKSGINYLLFWEAILGAKADGCAWYEIGEAFPQAAKGKEKGLTDFKGKFGGELHRLFRGELIVPQPQSQLPAVSTPNETELLTDKRTILQNWLNASRDLSSVILGKKITSIIRKLLLGVINLLRKSNNEF
jgi:hypothetical protein